MTQPKTYCNPLPLPDYQRGRACFEKKPDPRRWLGCEPRDFREMADPTVIRFKDRWYLFPSAGMLWHSDDMVNWTYHPIEPHDPGYAPTVAEKDGWLYMTACCDRMYRARNPFGPWELLGTLMDEKGNPTRWDDPMLFVDDDNSMYCTYGLGIDGIYIVKLKHDDPTRFDRPRVHCFPFNPDHIWERSGEHNQDPDKSYIEGSWLTKHNGRYYLQYSAPGTHFKNYSIGCYVADSPMGPYRYQARNPILTHKGGLVNGCAHHSMVEGPNGNLWCFYTTLVRIEHSFERRIGMDPAGFDSDGCMFVAGPTETPQLAPGITDSPELGNDAGLLPLSVNCLVTASSEFPGRDAVYAADDCIRTWWEADGRAPQWLCADLDREYLVSAARTMFADRGLDYEQGVLPGPYQYRIEGSKDGEKWNTLFDNSANETDRHIAYDTWPEAEVRYVRIIILGAPQGMRIALWEFTVFGRAG